ncbi:MAG: hypothetical protein ACYDHZ_00775 [Dehalococcoidia bacterium]
MVFPYQPFDPEKVIDTMLWKKPKKEAIKMEGKCKGTFERVAYVYNVGHALTRAWDFLEPERRQESITNIRARLVLLNDDKAVRPRESNDVFNFLDTLERYNKGEGSIHEITEKMDDLTAELAIHAIADCECIKPIK